MDSLPTKTVLLITLFLATVCCSCSRGGNGASGRIANQINVEGTSLGQDLEEFQHEAQRLIINAYEEILSENPPPQQRRNAILFRNRVIDKYQEILNADDPLNDLVRTWIYTHQLRNYFTSGAGVDYFGSQAAIGLACVAKIEVRLDELTMKNLSDEAAVKLRADTSEIAADNPIEGLFLESTTRTQGVSSLAEETVTTIATLPFAPFRTVGSINRGVGNLGEIPAIAREINQTIEDFPEELRWQAELLLADLESNDILTSAILGIQTVSESSERISISSERMATVAENLPEDVKRAVIETLEETARQQEEFRKTIEATERLLAQLETVMIETRRTGESLSTTADSVRSATEAIKRLAEGDPSRPRDPDKPPARPFDIREYDQAARSLTDAATRIAQVVESVRALEQENRIHQIAAEVRGEADKVVFAAAGESRGLVDYIFRRAAALAALIFVLLVVYQIIRRRLAPRATATEAG